jgi:hypothetical protein
MTDQELLSHIGFVEEALAAMDRVSASPWPGYGSPLGWETSRPKEPRSQRSRMIICIRYRHLC